LSIGQGVSAISLILAAATAAGLADIGAASAADGRQGARADVDGRSDAAVTRRDPRYMLAQATVLRGASGALDFDTRIRRADALLREGRPAEAYGLLSAAEYDGAGIIEFDYLLGAAAVDAGHPDRATLALERVLAQDPYHAGARIELGRAAMAMGDDAVARSEFEQVLALNPPEFARLRVMHYLADIDRRAHARRWTWSAYVSAFAGRDTNVNFAPSDSLVLLSSGTPITLPASNVRLADNVFGAGAGGELRYALDERTEAFLGWDGTLRDNARQSVFDLGSSDGRVGIARTYGRHVLNATVYGGEFYLDRNVYRRALGASIEWRHAVDDRNRLAPFLQYGELRYPGAEARALSTNQVACGLSWLHAFGAESQHLFFAGVFSLHESDVAGGPDGSRQGYGVRIGAQVAVRPGVNLIATAADLVSSYSRREPLFNLQPGNDLRRGDGRREFTLAVDWAVAPNWSVRPQFTRTEQDSNLKPYDYTRSESLITVRRDFR
jgi:outer membrane protein